MSEHHVDLRIEKTKKALSLALLSLLSEKPFESIKVSELCERAKVSRATFYNNFDSINDVFVYFLGYMFKPVVEQTRLEREQQQYDIDECFHRFLILIFQTFEQYYSSLKQIISLNPSPEVFTCINAYFVKLTKRLVSFYPELKFDVPTDLAIAYFAGGMTGAIINLLPNTNHLSESQIIEDVYLLGSGLYAQHVVSGDARR